MVFRQIWADHDWVIQNFNGWDGNRLQIEWGVTTSCLLPTDNSHFSKILNCPWSTGWGNIPKIKLKHLFAVFEAGCSSRRSAKNVPSFGGEKVRCMPQNPADKRQCVNRGQSHQPSGPGNHYRLERGLIDFKGTCFSPLTIMNLSRPLLIELFQIEDKGIRDQECSYDQFVGYEEYFLLNHFSCTACRITSNRYFLNFSELSLNPLLLKSVSELGYVLPPKYNKRSFSHDRRMRFYRSAQTWYRKTAPSPTP